MTDPARIADEGLVDAYLAARNAVVRAGYGPELQWQGAIDFEAISETDFLRESAWVVLASGMREAVVRSKFPAISEAFCRWHSAAAIIERKAVCRDEALRVFGHERKIDAILTICGVVCTHGFTNVKARIAKEGTDYISTLPFMGPATSCHLAKNLGMPIVKPDRHLCRMATAAGFPTPNDLCHIISNYVTDAIAVIDIVLWRYATLHTDYERLFGRP